MRRCPRNDMIAAFVPCSGCPALPARDAGTRSAGHEDHARRGQRLPESLKVDPSDAWQLVEVGRPGVVVPAQLVKAAAPDGDVAKGRLRVVASIPPSQATKGARQFRLEAVRGATSKPADFQFKAVNDASLALWDADKPVLVYNHGMVTVESVPKKDNRRTRSSYIHPLWGLQGEVLTDDAPKDHYHHRGVFWAWPHVSIDGQEYDLWMYKNIQQKFVRCIDREAGPVTATIGVENGWFVGDRKVMIERVCCSYHAAGHRWTSSSPSFRSIGRSRSVVPRARATAGSTCVLARRGTVITVPTGPAKQDLPDTPLAWADLTSKLKDPNAKLPSGAAVFVDPGHPDFPPTWLTRHYGILCVGWPGVKGKTFEPGVPIRLAYRIWIHNKTLDTATLQQAYDAYSQGLQAEWK